MPRIRRYYPASHMLNRDPEFIQLRRQFADWMGYVWHEMLAWGDHTEGELKGKPDAIAESLSSVSLTNRPSLARKHILNAFQYMQQCGWIRIETDRILILNHWKFHGLREDNKSQEGENKRPLLPSFLPTEQPTNLEPPIVPQNLGDAPVQSEPASAEYEPLQKKVRKNYSDGFSRFCEIHPWGSDSRAEAWEVWQRKKLEAHANEICLATETQKAWAHKAREGFEYFPRMPSFLRKERWKDKPIETTSRPPFSSTPSSDLKAFRVIDARNRQDEEEQRNGDPARSPQSAYGARDPVPVLGTRNG